MNGNEFVNKLKAESETILGKIDEAPISADIPKRDLLARRAALALLENRRSRPR